MIPCPVITAHPDGFVERTEPDRETHEVRCVRPPRRGISPQRRETTPNISPASSRDRGSPRVSPRAPRASRRDRAASALTPTSRAYVTAPGFLARSAYQLGKKKRSYNQVELTFDRASAGKAVNDDEASQDPTALNIYEATERSFSIDVPHDMRDSALEYELKLYNGSTVRALIYLVYAEPLTRPGIASDAKAADASTAKPLRAAPGGGVADAEGHTGSP